MEAIEIGALGLTIVLGTIFLMAIVLGVVDKVRAYRAGRKAKMLKKKNSNEKPEEYISGTFEQDVDKLIAKLSVTPLNKWEEDTIKDSIMTWRKTTHVGIRSYLGAISIRVGLTDIPLTKTQQVAARNIYNEFAPYVIKSNDPHKMVKSVL